MSAVYTLYITLKEVYQHSLSKCAKILKSNAIIEVNDANKKIADNFLTLYQSDWEERP